MSNAGVPTAVTCTGRKAAATAPVTPNPQFTGCTGVPAANAGNLVTATVNSAPVQTNLAANAAAGAVAIDVVTTTPFVPGWLWVNNMLVTCTGNTPLQFTGCTGVTANIANNSPITTNALSTAATGVIGGFIKIELKTNANAWQDVTMEVLNWGIGERNVTGQICANPTPNAIIKLQRLRDNFNTCNYAGSTNAWDHWPQTLFDTREGLQRDVAPGGTSVVLGGVMHYVALDVRNLSLWFQGIAPYNGGSGTLANNDGGAGFSVYFSDRRNNRNALSRETGEYGYEDFVNPATGAPNATLDPGEDVNANSALDVYGSVPNYNGLAGNAVPGAQLPLTTAATPLTQVSVGVAKVNRAILFRRALKLVNGGLGNIVLPGLTVTSENPVYVQGDWNANGAGFGNPSASTSVIADAVTLLSNNWSDNISFTNPYNPGARPRSANTFYRLAIISGKGPSFPWPNGTPDDFGTDGGAHNFLRYLEGGGGTLNYRGSIVTFYFNRQGVGTYKCCATVYSPPTRAYAFDTNFLNPALLPPLSPLFRDMNTLGFSEETRPGR
jgi:hypothetical protein